MTILATDTHELKTHVQPFAAAWDGRKNYEIREFDRDFKVGDTVVLREFHEGHQKYLTRRIRAMITYVTKPGEWGLPETVGVFGFRVKEKTP